jgi:hypothetical protein
MVRAPREESAKSLKKASSTVHAALSIAHGRKAGAFGAMARRLFLFYFLGFLMTAVPVIRLAALKLKRQQAETVTVAPASPAAPDTTAAPDSPAPHEEPKHAIIHTMPLRSRRAA